MGRVLCVTLFALIAAWPALGQDYPSAGLVFSTAENSSITFECRYQSGNRNVVNCDLVQTAVRYEVDAEGAKKEFEQAIGEYRSGKSLISADECKQYQEFRANPSQFERKSNATPPFNGMEKVKYREVIEALAKYCDRQNEQSFVDLTNFMLARKQRTCRVSSNAFKQTFHRQNNGVWTADPGPSGDCGVVRLDRFEAVEGSSGSKFWNYTSRKAVTNPNGKTVMGFQCNQLDEAEYQWKWDARRERSLDCQTISFSIF